MAFCLLIDSLGKQKKLFSTNSYSFLGKGGGRADMSKKDAKSLVKMEVALL